MPDKQIPKNVRLYHDTAIQVYSFFITLSPTLSKYIFGRILHDAYEVAYLHSTNLALTLLENVLKSNPNIENLKIKSLLNKKWEHLPPIKQLIQTYDCFDKNQYRYEYREYPELWKRLSIYIKNNDDWDSIINETIPIEQNCFCKMEYIIAFQKWNIKYATKEDEEYLSDFDIQCFKWYCMGELIDIIFNIIYNSTQTDISHALLDKLKETCENNIIFSKVVQKRYDKYREIRPYLKHIIFAPSGYNENNEVKKGLGPIMDVIYVKNEKTAKEITDEQYKKLFELLCQKKPLDKDITFKKSAPLNPADYEKFRTVFSNDEVEEELNWNTDAYWLGAFIRIAYITDDSSVGQQITNLGKRAAKYIYCKKGYVSVSVVRQPITCEQKDFMKEIFKKAGIYRK